MKHLLIHRHHHRPHHQVFFEMENHIGSHPNGNLKFKVTMKYPQVASLKQTLSAVIHQLCSGCEGVNISLLLMNDSRKD